MLPTIQLAGNCTDDPQLAFTPSGVARCTFTVACNERKKNAAGEWEDAGATFLNCIVWRQAAENCADTLSRGMAVTISGRLRQRSYETKEGEKRTVFEVEVDEVGPSLRNATAKVTKAGRTSSASSVNDDPWAGGAGNDEPPF